MESVVAASASIAVTQPKAVISACATGANRNCPKEPPALMNPEANERLSAGKRCAAAPIRIEKLPAPAPAAVRIPMAKISPKAELTNGVIAIPNASRRPPMRITRYDPTRSASMPKSGCAAPHTNWPTAIARLTVTIPRPVEELIDETNSPAVWRTPMVTARIAAEARTSVQNVRWGLNFGGSS